MSASRVDPLAALAASDPTTFGRKPCLVIRTLEPLGKTQASTLRFLIDESAHPSRRIAKAAKGAGVHLSEDAIQKHRRRDCPCPA